MEITSQQYDTKAEPDMLQLNMETISKELNDLIVTSEQEFAMATLYQPATAANSPNANLPQMPLPQTNFQDSMYLMNNLYAHQQLQSINGFQNTKTNLKYLPNAPISQLLFDFNTSNGYNTGMACYPPANYLCAPTSANISSSGSSTATPTYEFHYLKSSGEHEKKSLRYNNAMGNGAYRKTPKFMNKYINQKVQTSTLDSENNKIDLSKIDFFKNSPNKSNVQRLFDLLRDLHRALAEVPPNFEFCSDSQYEDTFSPLPSAKCLMSMTLNVQNQVKQACRKLTIFICEMHSIINANKIYDLNLYTECEYYLNSLRQYTNQFEMYKRIEMEHKRGQFLREEVKVHAEQLTLLLEQINRQVREIRLRILAFDWYMGVKYRGELCLSAKALSINYDDGEITKKSKIGVVNEILQLCNKTNTNTPVTSTQNAMIKTNSTTTITATKPDFPINSNANITYNTELMSVKSVLNENNNNFNVFLPDQMKTVLNTNNNNNNNNNINTRNPVFYIG
ncbi:hypothetical protein DOY81_004743 [Sarcophaga bullata]|nr:hypothetical protein DOY81_004743 [Sarcophaga bullata]